VDPETKKATGFLFQGSSYVNQKESQNQLLSAVLGETFKF
jgi:hypothetical protein